MAQRDDAGRPLSLRFAQRRRLLLGASGLLALPLRAIASDADFAPVVPGRILRFPEDEGSHPEFRTEWWYVTGWLDADTRPLGFQITFFRTRPHADTGNPSRFDPRDLLIAHTAISEQSHGRLRDEQKIARAGFGLAEARTGATDVRIDRWRLHAEGTGYRGRIEARAFEMDLRFEPTQPPLLQGVHGYSRKGPDPRSSSYYYSLPQLAVDGTLRLERTTRTVRGTAWFDHEWSSEAMDAEAVGWDWIGINLDDSSALMAFRMRAKNGAQHWAAATLRTPDRSVQSFAPEEVAWMPGRTWRSPRTGANYPVAPRIRIGQLTLDLDPMMDDQENDTRGTTGAIYWEGAVTALRDGRRIGRGYLEMTGYAGVLRLA